MSEVVYDKGYDNRMIKKRQNMVTVWLLVAIKEKFFCKSHIQIPQKIYQDSKEHCHIQALNIVTYIIP